VLYCSRLIAPNLIFPKFHYSTTFLDSLKINIKPYTKTKLICYNKHMLNHNRFGIW